MSDFAQPISKIIWLPLGLVFLFFGGQLALRLLSHSLSASWTRVPAVVLRIEEHPKSATLRYGYRVGGEDYEGSKFQFMSPGTVPERSQILAGYKAGDDIMVFVNPSNPQQSVVRRDPIQLEDLSNYLLLFFACGMVGMFSVMNQKTEQAGSSNGG
jgi:hypothetical protein